jgi:hypothetical protein
MGLHYLFGLTHKNKNNPIQAISHGVNVEKFPVLLTNGPFFFSAPLRKPD